MPFYGYNQKPGVGSVGQYQMAGRPWVTGSTHMVTSSTGAPNAEQKIEFPQVTKSFTIINKAAVALDIHFMSRASGSVRQSTVISQKHYITLDNQDDSISIDCRVKDVYVSLNAVGSTGSFQLIAELTSISRDSMHAITGSGIDTLVD